MTRLSFRVLVVAAVAFPVAVINWPGWAYCFCVVLGITTSQITFRKLERRRIGPSAPG